MMSIEASDPVLQQIRSLGASLLSLGAALPLPPLRPGEAQALGGQLFAEAPIFVEAVARALRGRAQLFPDVPARPEGLLGAQARAGAYRQLALQLGGLAALCQGAALAEQAGATREALAVTQQVLREGKLPYEGGLDRARRLLALQPALWILRRRQRRKAKAQERGAPVPALRPRRLPTLSPRYADLTAALRRRRERLGLR